jgi:hypothetical protein
MTQESWKIEHRPDIGTHAYTVSIYGKLIADAETGEAAIFDMVKMGPEGTSQLKRTIEAISRFKPLSENNQTKNEITLRDTP